MACWALSPQGLGPCSGNLGSLCSAPLPVGQVRPWGVPGERGSSCWLQPWGEGVCTGASPWPLLLFTIHVSQAELCLLSWLLLQETSQRKPKPPWEGEGLSPPPPQSRAVGHPGFLCLLQIGVAAASRTRLRWGGVLG